MTDKVQKIRAEIERRIEEEQRIRREKDKLTGVGSIIDTRYESLLSFIDSMQEEPVSEDFKQFEETYLDKEKDEILCIYDRHAGLVDGANWQKEQLTAKTVDVTIAIPYPNGDGGYTQLVDSKEALPFGDNIKVLVIKEE